MKYYAGAVWEQLQSGLNLEDVEVDFRLLILKPLHAQWLVTYNHFTSGKRREIISKGWKKAEIYGLVDGTTELPPKDPFKIIFE